MFACAKLNVNNVIKDSRDLTYEDLCYLYREFINNNGYVPIQKDLLTKNNLPQFRIVIKILELNNITYNDFMLQFGKSKKVRSNIKNWDKYLDKFIQTSKDLGKTIPSNKLSEYGLPGVMWFINNCPDDNVKTYTEFVKWCNLPSIKKVWTKEEVKDELFKLQQELKRPIIKSDINSNNTKFSVIVINRLWGSFSKCKEKLGLLKTETSKSLPFSYYKNKIDDFLERWDSEYLTWRDIESQDIEHKSITNAFKRNGIDFGSYIKSKGFMFAPTEYSYRYMFDNGERVYSSYEYQFSKYLSEIGFEYQKDYVRDVMYKTFIDGNIKNKTNCDYVFDNKYVEIAGVIDNENGDWENVEYKSSQKQEYKSKMIYKKTLFEQNQKEFLFLFPCDFRDGTYKEKFLRFKGGDIYDRKNCG